MLTKAYVYEALTDDDRMSLNMLIETTGGFDYTGADCCEWMQEVSFTHTCAQHLLDADSMVVGIK